MKNGFADFGSHVGKAFSDAYNAEIAASQKEEAAQEDGAPQVAVPSVVTPNPTAGTLGTVGSGSSTGSGGKIKSVTVNIERLVERFEIHTTNLQGDVSRVKDMVSEALLSALNDVNLAM